MPVFCSPSSSSVLCSRRRLCLVAEDSSGDSAGRLKSKGIHFEMSSTNMDVVAQDVAAEEQQQEPPVEATANFVPDESASIENSNKSSVKSVYWQYFTRFQEEKDWKAK
ncbi:uncharacterized protein LOC110262589 [Arachis ipaensis]|uniref:uncharacterized protein LOC110262589 n=1 Tax=Arachis ipaensis TaxID=130454 RepID=UPI000A2B0DDB|nr:uncharacterized protein LOC110262589 [Arachis ipaensis]